MVHPAGGLTVATPAVFTAAFVAEFPVPAAPDLRAARTPPGAASFRRTRPTRPTLYRRTGTGRSARYAPATDPAPGERLFRRAGSRYLPA